MTATTIAPPLATSHHHLPPSSRDLEIHRQNAIEFLSTRNIAERFNLSQTRVRQIIARVNDWLAEVLPVPSEADIEKQKRLALHLAAAQLRHQIETLATYWSATGDPKFLRQQNRSILALARLGVPPTTLDSITAQVEEDAAVVLPSSDLSPPASDLGSPPLSRDCSPSPVAAFKTPSSAIAPEGATIPSCKDLEPDWLLDPDTLAGLELMEKRPLTLLDDTLYSDSERRSSLTETLNRVRCEKANLILKLTPATPGAKLSDDESRETHKPAGQARDSAATTPTIQQCASQESAV
jgi:hypothetical protein